MTVNPIQPDGNAVDRLRSRFEAITETTADQRALVEQLETVLEILDQPGVAAPRAHHPSARGRSRRAPKSKPDQLQAALSQLLVEQQLRQQVEQDFAAAQETVQHLIDLVARRDKQLVSARHAWDLLKSRSRMAAEELSERVKELEGEVEHRIANQRELETRLGQTQHDQAPQDTVCERNEQTAATEKFLQAAEFANSLEQQLGGAREEAARLAARRDELQHALQRLTCEQRSATDAAREREAILVQQLEEVQFLLGREQESRRQSEQKCRDALRQRDEAGRQLSIARREQRDHESGHQLDQARLADGVQALKAELHQLHIERLATNGFIEQMIGENEANQKLAQQRHHELSQACAQATNLAEAKEARLAETLAELEGLRQEFASTVASHSARVAEHDRIAAALQAEQDRLRAEFASSEAAKDAEMAKLRSGMQRATIMLESQRRQLAEAEQSLAAEQALAKERETLHSQQVTLVAQLQAKIESLQTSLQREAAARRKAESRGKAAGEEAGEKLTIEDAEQRIDRLSGELAAFKKLSKTLKHKSSHKLRSARQEIARLKAQIELLSPRQI